MEASVAADRNVLVDAYLVFTLKNGCKAASQNTTAICGVFFPDEGVIYGGCVNP